jgi:hypothetical protein
MRVAMLVAGALLISLGARAQGGTVEGIVFDSLDGRPLAGALVQIVASPPGQEAYSATSDSLGASESRMCAQVNTSRDSCTRCSTPWGSLRLIWP